MAEDDTVEYMGQIIVPRDNDIQYVIDVQFAVNDDGDWDGFGFLLLGQLQIPPAVTLLEEHPKVKMATYDLSELVFDGLKVGEILFGIDQQPYLQGYLPVPLLTYMAYSRQRLANTVIESGPSFVLNPPTEEQQVCETNFYTVCGDGSGIATDPPTEAPMAGSSMLQLHGSVAKSIIVGSILFLYLFG